MMALIQYAGQSLMYAVQTMVFVSRIPRAMISAKRIEEIVNLEPVVTGADNAPDETGTFSEITFESVCFRYPGAERPVLDDVSFTIKRGEISAIIGSTGSGKTTIINLIERFADVHSGAIKIDGVDIREIKQEALRKRLALSPQQTYIFSGTVRSALLDGKPDATVDEVSDALCVAQAEEFVSQMENNADAEISQGGTNLSGGQKQRLSIARALVRKPDFYIFDDSFSALDYKTDLSLRQALGDYLQGAGALIIAQRVVTVKDADRIIVIDEGKVADIGTHDELLARCEIYSEINRSQLSLEVSL